MKKLQQAQLKKDENTNIKESKLDEKRFFQEEVLFTLRHIDRRTK